MTPLRKIIG